MTKFRSFTSLTGKSWALPHDPEQPPRTPVRPIRLACGVRLAAMLAACTVPSGRKDQP
jgi:hypothetical protein